jgi:hypothetical protein
MPRSTQTRKRPRKFSEAKTAIVNELRRNLVIQEAHITPLLGANDEELFIAKRHLNEAINALVDYVNR